MVTGTTDHAGARQPVDDLVLSSPARCGRRAGAALGTIASTGGAARLYPTRPPKMAVESDSVLLQFVDPSSPRRVALEDDGRVAYAYLLKNDAIVADVWLYNVGGDPEQVNWKDSSNMPFQNPAGYCGYEEMERLSPSLSIKCVWLKAGVVIRVGGRPWAKLMEGSKPGWSRNAATEGPLAKPLEDVLPDGDAG